MATHLAPFPPDQMPRKDFGLHFFTFLPPQGEVSTYTVDNTGTRRLNNYAVANPSKTTWDRFFLHPNISYCAQIKSGTYLNETTFGLTDGLRVTRPPGYPNFTGLTGPQTIQTHPNNALLTAIRIAEWFEYMGYKRGKGVLMPDGKEYAGAIHLSKLGSSQDGVKREENFSENSFKRLLFFNNDRINSQGNVIPDPEFGDNGRLPYCFGHHTKASLRNRPVSPTHGLTLGDFVKEVMVRLRDQCDSRDLCYPLFLINDLEDRVGPGGSQYNLNYRLRQADVDERVYTRFRSALIGRWDNRDSPVTDNNIFNGMLNDAGQMGQTFNEPVYYDWNGSEWTEKTLLQGFEEYGIGIVGPNQNQISSSDWKSIDPDNGKPIYWFKGTQSDTINNVDNFVAGITSDGTMSFRNLRYDYRNHITVKKLNLLYNRIADHGLSKVFYEPIKEVFPHMRCGNRGLVAVLDNQICYYDANNIFNKTPFVSEPRGKRLFRGDYSSPSLFGPVMTDFPGKYGPARYRNLNNVDISTYHSFGTTPQQIWRNFLVHQVKACFAGENPLPVIPLIPLPHENWTSANGSGGYTPQLSDYLYVLQEHYKMGVRNWLVYNQGSIIESTPTSPPSPPSPPPSPPAQSIAIPTIPVERKLGIEWMIDVIDEFTAWTSTYNYVPPQPPPRPTELNPVNPVGVRMKRFRVN